MPLFFPFHRFVRPGAQENRREEDGLARPNLWNGLEVGGRAFPGLTAWAKLSSRPYGGSKRKWMYRNVIVALSYRTIAAPLRGL